jgi:acyl-coenzyme A synthetase/AMP-(fatty) acid ligase
MDVVADLLARDRRSRDVALVTPDGRERTYRDLITNAYKSANVLRYLGAREGSTVAVDPSPGLHTTLGFLGAAGLGAPVRFDPAVGIERGDRVILIDVAEESTTKPSPGTSLAVFGGPPERPETTHWEQELWSENPGMPPSAIGPDDPVLRGSGDGEPNGSGDVSHRALLDAAASVVEEQGLEPGDRTVLRGGLADPRALAAGVVAPLMSGATAVLIGEQPTDDGSVVAVDGGDGDPRPISLPAVVDE